MLAAQPVRTTRLLDASATHTAMPQVSIVLVVSSATPSPAARVSTAITACKEHGAELLVAWCGPRAALRSLETAFPAVRFVTADGDDVDVRALRTRACQLAEGDVVSVVSESQPLDETWFARRLGVESRAWREGGTA